MAVDLNDLIPRLRVEVNPPGVDLYPNATDAEMLLHMQNGFWEAFLDGLIEDYSVNDDGVVTPNSGTTDLLPELQQIVLIYAGMKIVRNLLLNMRTKFNVEAGPVKYEIQQSANMMREILLDMKNRKILLLNRLSDMGVSDAFIVDAVVARSDALYYGDTVWVSGGS